MGFNEFLERIVGAVLPKRDRIAHIEKLTLETVPLSITTRELEGVSIITLLDYRESIVEDLIRSLKYDGAEHSAALCAGVLAEYLREEIASIKLYSAKKVLLIPVPLHPSRERERGFNQMHKVLKHLPGEFRNGPLSLHAPKALARVKATRQQTHLSKEERRLNMVDAFAIMNHELIRDTHIFLIDDVATTGATLSNAAKRLEDAGATVRAIALACA